MSSAPVSEILSKADHRRQKKWRHVDFQDGVPSWIVGIQYNNGFFEKLS